MSKQFAPTVSLNWASYFSNLYENKFPSMKSSFSRTQDSFKKFDSKFPTRILLIIIGIIIIVGTVVIAKTSRATQTDTNSQPSAPAILASMNINREFDFPIKDANGKEISKIKYLVQSAALQDEILVKGERARAVQGRTFLIVNLLITNSYKQGIQINSRDYIRLVVDGKKDELMAADIHNDPVEVQAISTKLTRLGFPINSNYKTLEIQVGEINGAKQTIKLDLSKN